MCKMFVKVSNFVRHIIAPKLWAASSFAIFLAFSLWWFFGAFYAFCIIAIGFGSLCYNAQDLLLYYPSDPPNSRAFVHQPSHYNLPYENIKIKTKDGLLIHLFFIKQPNTGVNPPTLIFFHGNAGNMGQRLANVQGLYQNLNINILMMEYRGYGLSEGAPTEHGLRIDAQAALEYLLQRNDIDHSKIILFGRSLGGAIAIDLCSRIEYKNKIWALIVENTFTSIPDMAKIIVRWRLIRCLPLFFHKNKYMSLKKMGHVTVPTLVVCGTNDTLVPPSMSEALHQRCAAIHKKLVMIKGGGHNDTWTCHEYYPALQHFLANLPPLILTQPYYDETFNLNKRSSHSFLVHDV